MLSLNITTRYTFICVYKCCKFSTFLNNFLRFCFRLWSDTCMLTYLYISFFKFSFCAIEYRLALRSCGHFFTDICTINLSLHLVSKRSNCRRRCMLIKLSTVNRYLCVCVWMCVSVEIFVCYSAFFATAQFEYGTQADTHDLHLCINTQLSSFTAAFE